MHGDVRLISEDTRWVSPYSGQPIASWSSSYNYVHDRGSIRGYLLSCYIDGCDTRALIVVLNFTSSDTARNFARRWGTRMRKTGGFVHPKEVSGYADHL